MSTDESYRTLRNRIAQLMILIQTEKSKSEYWNVKEESQHFYRLKNLQELLDVNMRTFAMLFNRNFDVKLDSDPELQ